MRTLAKWSYHACVEVLLNLCGWTGLTYRDVNALLLLVLFPSITMFLLVTLLGRIWAARSTS